MVFQYLYQLIKIFKAYFNDKFDEVLALQLAVAQVAESAVAVARASRPMSTSSKPGLGKSLAGTPPYVSKLSAYVHGGVLRDATRHDATARRG